jgi:hypothetical protein
MNLVGVPVTVTVRASGGAGITVSNSATFTIASLEATGSLIYWTTTGFDNNATSTSLNGFHVGDTGNVPILTSAQVTQQVVATEPATTPGGTGMTPGTPVAVFCIGCHTTTPDGAYVAFTAQWPWPNALANLSQTAGMIGTAPPWLGAGGLANLSPVTGKVMQGGPWYEPPEINQMMLGMQTFSGGHYGTTAGEYIEVTSLGAAENATSLTALTTPTGVVSELAWINLGYTDPVPATAGLPLAPCGTNPAPAGACLPAQTPNPAWGIIARTGDTGSAGAPSWTHNLDGKTDIIAYTSTTSGTKDGRLNDGPADIYTVPYTSNGVGLGGAGGTATPLPGASSSANNEYYPAWSPDDQLIAFNQVPSGTSLYNEPAAEVYVIPYNGGMGGTETRLAANDPVACTGSMAMQLQNTLPKWAPLADTTAMGAVGNKGADGKLYYWVTFSSIRTTACTISGSNVCTATQAAGATGNAQLYVAGVVVDPANNNAITTYPAIYLWNQDFTANNLIPSWTNSPAIPPGIASTETPK